MNIKKAVYILFITIASCTTENERKEDIGNKTLISSDYLRIGDELICKNIKSNAMLIYAKSNNQYIKVENQLWPESIQETYNLLQDSVVKVYIEVPYSESGDWNNTFTYYYDINGNLRASKVVSSFFNSNCYEGALTETVLSFFNSQHKLDSNAYTLVDDKGNSISDTSKCVFNYRLAVQSYHSYSEIPLLKATKR
jgi:hypothetical protein